MYHARDTTYSIVKDQRESHKHTSTHYPFYEKQVRHIIWLPVNAKRAAIFGGRPLENRNFYSKMVRSPHVRHD